MYQTTAFLLKCLLLVEGRIWSGLYTVVELQSKEKTVADHIFFYTF